MAEETAVAVLPEASHGARPLSDDLRVRLVEVKEASGTIRAVGDRFRVSPSSVKQDSSATAVDRERDCSADGRGASFEFDGAAWAVQPGVAGRATGPDAGRDLRVAEPGRATL